MASAPPYDPRTIANELLHLANEYGLLITHLTIQKAVYFLHEKYLHNHDVPLCLGHFEAWQHGPVHPQLWESFKKYGSEPVTAPAEGFDILTGEAKELPRVSSQEDRRFLTAKGLGLIELPAHRLVGLSHARGGPWDAVTRIGGKRHYGARIPNELIVQKRNGRLMPVRDSRTSDEVMYEQPPTRD